MEQTEDLHADGLAAVYCNAAQLPFQLLAGRYHHSANAVWMQDLPVRASGRRRCFSLTQHAAARAPGSSVAGTARAACGLLQRPFRTCSTSLAVCYLPLSAGRTHIKQVSSALQGYRATHTCFCTRHGYLLQGLPVVQHGGVHSPAPPPDGATDLK